MVTSLWSPLWLPYILLSLHFKVNLLTHFRDIAMFTNVHCYLTVFSQNKAFRPDAGDTVHQSTTVLKVQLN